MLKVLLPNGRGIAFEVLTATARDKVLADAAKLIGNLSGEGAFFELRQVEQRLGVKSMLRSMTVATGLKDEDLIKPETKWKQLTMLELDTNYDKFFSAKEHMILSALYRKFHEVDASEVDDIVKKVLEVSEG